MSELTPERIAQMLADADERAAEHRTSGFAGESDQEVLAGYCHDLAAALADRDRQLATAHKALATKIAGIGETVLVCLGNHNIPIRLCPGNVCPVCARDRQLAELREACQPLADAMREFAEHSGQRSAETISGLMVPTDPLRRLAALLPDPNPAKEGADAPQS